MSVPIQIKNKITLIFYIHEPRLQVRINQTVIHCFVEKKNEEIFFKKKEESSAISEFLIAIKRQKKLIWIKV